MRILTFFGRHYLRRVTRFFRRQTGARLATVLLFVGVFFAVMLGAFFFARAGFRLIEQDPLLKDVMSLYTYELFLLILQFFIIVSAAIASLTTVLKRSQDSWIIATPAYHYLPYYHYLQVCISSLWPFMVIAIPALIAQSLVFETGLLALGLSLLGVFLFVAFTSVTVLSLLLIISCVIGRFGYRKRLLRLVTLVIAGIVVMFGAVSWRQAAPLDIFTVLGVDQLSVSTISIEPVLERFRLFPSHQAASVIYLGQQSLQAVVRPFLVLLSSTVLAHLVFRLSSRWFLDIWQRAQESTFDARAAEGGRPKHARPVRFPRFLRSPLGALFEKEVLLYLRSNKNRLWFGFILALWLIITGFNIGVVRSLDAYSLQTSILPSVVFAFQIGVAIYFITALVLRFALPSFAYERRTVWILGGAPIDTDQIFFAKSTAFASLFLLVSLTVSVINAVIFEMTLLRAVGFVVLIGTATVTVSLMGTAIGAMFPNYDSDDPEVISTSSAGLMFMVVSLIYGSFGAYSYYHFLATGGSLTLLLLYAVITVGIIQIIVGRVPSQLDKRDWVKIRD